MNEFPCQYYRHPAGGGYATNRVRFFCTRCTRGNTPETQTDTDLCDRCQAEIIATKYVLCPECGLLADASEFTHPDGPPTGRPIMHAGQELTR